MSYFAIVYACALAVLGALIVWVVPMTVIAIGESIASKARARRKAHALAPAQKPRARPLAPRIPGLQRLSHTH